MGTYSLKELLAALPKKDRIFICGPDDGETRLRVYAYGGLLCKLPVAPGSDMDLLSSNYLKNYLSEKPSLFAALQKLSGNDEKMDFLLDNLDDLMLCTNRKFTSTKGTEKERNQQTTISRAHTDFSQHRGTVVCDFQFSVPEAIVQAEFDLVTFSPSEKVFTLVEYKCNARACRGENGLEKHAADMLKCMDQASDWCKRELLRRLDYMRDYGLLQPWPKELEHLTPENVDLRAAFLFTPGAGLRDREKAAALCEKHIPADKRKRKDLLYCFANSLDTVDLSDMQSWETFSKADIVQEGQKPCGSI